MTATILLIALILATVAYGIYLAATIRGDGYRFSRRQPPASHYRDEFDPRIGPTRLA